MASWDGGMHFSEKNLKDSISYAARKLGVEMVKPQQEKALMSFLRGHDVFIILPTGMGKSFVFQAAPYCWDYLQSCILDGHDDPGDIVNNNIVLVVAPIIALVEDQIQKLSELGVAAAFLSDKTEGVRCRIENGEFSIVFCSPESIATNDSRAMLRTTTYRKRLRGIFIDECHCITDWGEGEEGQEAFREEYGRLGELRAMVPKKLPMVGLTATVTEEARLKIQRSLGLRDIVLIEESPEKDNIKYVVVYTKRHYQETFKFLVEELRRSGKDTERVIIYVRARKQCHILYGFFEESLEDTTHFAMYHRNTSEAVKKKVTEDMSNTNGSIRVLIATIAFGLGVDVKAVNTIIHYGAPSKMEEYVQTSGRAGRDGSLSTSVLVDHVGSREMRKQPCHDSIKKYLINKEKLCRRSLILKAFGKERRVNTQLQLHNCCDVCTCKCICGECSYTFYEKELMKSDMLEFAEEPLPEREVSEDHRERLRLKLISYRDSLLESTSDMTLETSGTHESMPYSKPHLYCGKDFATGFTLSTVQSVVSECERVYSYEQFQERYGFASDKYAKDVWDILQSELGDCRFQPSENTQDPMELQDEFWDSDEEVDNLDNLYIHDSSDEGSISSASSSS